jgi:hypothetical protein
LLLALSNNTARIALEVLGKIIKALGKSSDTSNKAQEATIGNKINLNDCLLSIGNLLSNEAKKSMHNDAKDIIIDYCYNLEAYSKNPLLEEVDLDYTNDLMHIDCLLRCAHISGCDEVGHLLLTLDAKKYKGTKYE